MVVGLNGELESFFSSIFSVTRLQEMNSVISWIKKNPLIFGAAVLVVFWFWRQRSVAMESFCDDDTVEDFSTCIQRKQIYLNACDSDEPTAHADVNLEKRWGKFWINIQANLPYARGGVFHSMWGAYSAFLIDSRNKKSINLGSLVRHGDRMYKLSTELLGDYSDYDRIDIYRQTEDYAPKRVLTGSIVSQNCSSL